MQTISRLFTLLLVLFSIQVWGQEINCDDGIDNDNDGLIDLNDIDDCDCSIDIPSLIPNPSFEDYVNCPTSSGMMDDAEYWDQVSGPSTDYLNQCGLTRPWIPTPYPDGTGVVGAFIKPTWQELVGTCLASPFPANTDYTLQMSLCCALVTSGTIFTQENTWGPYEVTIYGHPDCNNVNVNTPSCVTNSTNAAGWVVIGSYTYDPSLAWQEINIPIHATQDINAIIIGSVCEDDFPPAYQNMDFNHNLYMVYDNLILNESSMFPESIEASYYNESLGTWGSEAICTSQIELSIDYSQTGNYQWYFEGVAMVGENNATLLLNTDMSSYGEYSCKFIPTGSSECLISNLTLLAPAPPTADFQYTLTNNCFPTNVDLVSNSVSGNSEGLIDWTWSMDGNEISSGTGAAFTTINDGNNHAIQLVVEGSNYCKDSVTVQLDLSEPPTVNFSVTDVCVNEEITLVDNSNAGPGTIIDWNWNFANNTTSADPNPTGISYDTPDDYYISLTVTNDLNCIASDSTLITVHPDPIVTFNTAPVCVNEAANFPNDAGANTHTWEWNFGDGTNPVMGENATHSYATPGNYTVTLTNTSEDGCIGTSNGNQEVLDCSSPLTFSYENVCVGDTVFFEANIPTNIGFNLLSFNWDWNFGDGNSSTDVLSTWHILTSDQPYEVSLTVSDNFGNSFSYDLQVSCFPTPLVSFVNDAPCLGCNINFSNQSSILNNINWTWNFDDGSTSNQENPTNQYALPGTYTVSLTGITNNGCSGTFNQDLVIGTEPLDVNFTAENFCIGSQTNFTDITPVNAGTTVSNWTWTFGDGSTSNDQHASHSYILPGDYTVTLEVSDGTNTYSALQEITIHPTPQVSFSSDVVCLGDTNQVTNLTSIETGSIVRWDWQFEGNTEASDLHNPNVFFDTTGTYLTTLTATSNMGCVGIGYGNLIVAEVAAHINVSANSGCAPLCGNFEAITTNSYGVTSAVEWQFSDSTSSSGSSIDKCFENVTTSEVLTFDVSLNVSNSLGCTAEIESLEAITVWPNPRADFESETYNANMDDPNINLENTSIDANIFTWSFGDDSYSSEENPSNEYAAPGIYAVSLTASNDFGCSDKVMKPFVVEAVNHIYIPNAFTPQEDGINDLFRPIISGEEIDKYSFRIYDRNGQIVFESEDPNDLWNGKYRNQESYYVLDGIYNYTLQIKFVSDTDVAFRNGNILVLR